MKFTVTIDCDNDAFSNDFFGELDRILREVRGEIRYLANRPGQLQDGNIRDVNGNTVARWELVDE